MADFLLELRCEEIPARMQMTAREELQILFRRQLESVGVDLGFDFDIWTTPRRLALIARGLPLATKAVREEVKGPPEGAPDAAIDGFCKKNGVNRDQLELRDIKGRMTYFAAVEQSGRPILDVLAEAIPAIVKDFHWPKSMRWGEASRDTESLRWVRPLSGIVALLDNEVIPCEVGGLHSGRETFGHRFHHQGPIIVESVTEYADKLRAAYVIVDHQERQDIIRAGVAKAFDDMGLEVIADEGLVIENAGLTEWPVPLVGGFDEAFLAVPPEVIQLSARLNQKYFMARSADETLAPVFACVANIAPKDGGGLMVAGNEKVLAARLSDARFFWEQDQKTSLEDHAKKLSRITFHEKLGTVADKVERVAKLARWLVEEGIVKPSPLQGRGLGEGTSASPAAERPLSPTLSPEGEREKLADLAEQAARLCKADLVTEMVGEFPELQGLMGGYYAAKEGLPQEVSDAIRDHYKPVGQGDEVPTAPVTVAVSLADKLDTLAGFFLIDERPTGSKDPFALRRAGIAINSIAIANSLSFSMLATLMRASFGVLDYIYYREHDQKLSAIQEVFPLLSGPEGALALLDAAFPKKDRVLDPLAAPTVVQRDRENAARLHEMVIFLFDRLKVQQREAGVRHDLIDAVFALGGEDDLVRLLARVHALQAFVTTEDGTNLLAGYKRAANILKKEGYPPRDGEGDRPKGGGGDSATSAGIGGKSPPSAAAPLPPPRIGEAQELTYTPEPAEQALIDALDAAAPRAAQAVEAERFADAMAALATLRAPIDRFFEEVTVNDQQAEKRAARLSLLARFRDAVHRVADFSRIEG